MDGWPSPVMTAGSQQPRSEAFIARRALCPIPASSPLPTPADALAEPFRAFPSWFPRITGDRCGKGRMLSETHTPQGDMLIRDIIARMCAFRWNVNTDSV